MPLYDYICKACEHEWEVLQKVDDPAPDHCPACANTVEGSIVRQIGRTNFQLKGTGWYVTDFKKDKPSE